MVVIDVAVELEQRQLYARGVQRFFRQWAKSGWGRGEVPTISSSHIGQTSLGLDASASEGPPILILEARS